jgi:hypothetical protein
MKGNFQQRIGKLEARLDQKADTRGFEIVRQMVGRWVAEHEAKDGRSEAPATECSSTIPEEIVPEDAAPEAIVPEDAAQEAPALEDVKPIEAVRRLFEHEASYRPIRSWDPPDEEDGEVHWDRSSGSRSGAERSDRYRRRRG